MSKKVTKYFKGTSMHFKEVSIHFQKTSKGFFWRIKVIPRKARKFKERKGLDTKYINFAIFAISLASFV